MASTIGANGRAPSARSTHPPWRTIAPLARAFSNAADRTRDLPMPASPPISTVRPCPCVACCSACEIASSSGSRPISSGLAIRLPMRPIIRSVTGSRGNRTAGRKCVSRQAAGLGAATRRRRGPGSGPTHALSEPSRPRPPACWPRPPRGVRPFVPSPFHIPSSDPSPAGLSFVCSSARSRSFRADDDRLVDSARHPADAQIWRRSELIRGAPAFTGGHTTLRPG